MPKALLIEIEAKAAAAAEMAQFLRDALGAAENEPQTRDWYALRFDERRFAVFDTFDGNLDRLRHLAGTIGRGLALKSLTSLSSLPDITTAELIAAKLPTGTTPARFAVCAAIETRQGQGRDFGEYLVEAKSMADGEAGTLAWYALRNSPNAFAVVAAFADEGGRTAHLAGEAAAGMERLVGRYLDAAPTFRTADVLACKQSGWLEMASAAQEVHAKQPERISPEPG